MGVNCYFVSNIKKSLSILNLCGFIVKLGNFKAFHASMPSKAFHFMPHSHLVAKVTAKWGFGLPSSQPKLKFS